MNSFLSPRKMKLLVPACGILGLLLRLLYAATGTDRKGLLVSGHPAWIALLLLCAAAAAAVVLCVRGIRGPDSYRASFPHSNLSAAGNVLAAIGAVACTFHYWRGDDVFVQAFSPAASAARLLGGAALSLAPVAFLLAAVCRRRGRKPNFLLHVVICIYFAIQALSLYQTWSFDPQIQEYCFQLFASIALTMTAYQLALFDLDKGSHRKLWLFGLAAVYLCCLSLDCGLFYITGAIWAITALSSLRRKRTHKPAEEAVPTNEMN